MKIKIKDVFLVIVKYIGWVIFYSVIGNSAIYFLLAPWLYHSHGLGNNSSWSQQFVMWIICIAAGRLPDTIATIKNIISKSM
jgi:hypothetical protein